MFVAGVLWGELNATWWYTVLKAMKKGLLVAFTALVLLVSLAAELQAVEVAEANSNIIFSDYFDGTMLDSTKWIVQEDTNMSGYPGYGGNVKVENSEITLSSNGSSFPYITSAVNPFASGDDFVLEFDFTYKGISDFGNGLWITNGPPRIFYNDTTKESATKTIFSLWADNNQSYTRSRISVTLLGQEVWTSYITGWEPNTPTYTFRLSYTDDTYTVFVDDIKMASAQSQLQPDSISFGHPPAIYVPFSEAHLQSLLGQWTSFTIDYIQVLQSQITSPTPIQTPIPIQSPTSTLAPIITIIPTLSPSISPSSYAPQQPIIEANQAGYDANNETYALTAIIVGSLAIAVIVGVLFYFAKQIRK